MSRQLGNRTIWSLRELSRAVAKRFDDIPSFWVEAEVANLRAGGQQMYFTLVDDSGDEKNLVDASMNAIVFDRLAMKPVNGTLVHAYGRVEYWAARNQVTYRVERIEFTGDGQLQARIEELRRVLDAEGLTDPGRKRPLPFLPRRIGLVTSADGAARADVLTNLTTRFPVADVCVVHALVQGANAPAEIVRGLRYLDALSEVDVIVVARGGGSLDDLMAFNSETVCRAVADCDTPVVSAIGHETDITLCDLVADVRVSTPTKAAEAVVPEFDDLVGGLRRAEESLNRFLDRTVARSRDRLVRSTRQLAHGLRTRGRVAHAHVVASGNRLTPALRNTHRRAAIDVSRDSERLQRAARAMIERRASRLERLADLHHSLSPARTVTRGYAIVRRTDETVVTEGQSVAVGEAVTIELRDGRIVATRQRSPRDE